jgi:hypothetical protein
LFVTPDSLFPVKIPLDEVKKDWWLESGAQKIPILAEHYGIFNDLFGGNYFVPVVNLSISFDYDDESVTPVCYGNKIPPAEVSVTRSQLV